MLIHLEIYEWLISFIVTGIVCLWVLPGMMSKGKSRLIGGLLLLIGIGGISVIGPRDWKYLTKGIPYELINDDIEYKMYDLESKEGNYGSEREEVYQCTRTVGYREGFLNVLDDEECYVEYYVTPAEDSGARYAYYLKVYDDGFAEFVIFPMVTHKDKSFNQAYSFALPFSAVRHLGDLITHYDFDGETGIIQDLGEQTYRMIRYVDEDDQSVFMEVGCTTEEFKEIGDWMEEIVPKEVWKNVEKSMELYYRE